MLKVRIQPARATNRLAVEALGEEVGIEQMELCLGQYGFVGQTRSKGVCHSRRWG